MTPAGARRVRSSAGRSLVREAQHAPEIHAGDLVALRGRLYRVVAVRSDGSQKGGLILDVLPAEGRGGEPGQDRLTRREQQVARLLAHRASNQEIAAALGISPHTARHHTERVLSKLGVQSRSDVRARLLPDANEAIRAEVRFERAG